MWGGWPAWEVLALAVITVVALLLRLNGYDGTPPLTDDADELNFAWGGLNLILIHDAYTWSYFSAYPAHTIVAAHGTTYPLVHHWLDHPPLFSLVIGGWLWLLGVRDMLAVTAAQMRVPPVLFSTLTVPLAHVLGRRFLGSAAGLCGVALLATAPAAVLLGRVAEAESLLAVVLLVALILTAQLLRRPEAMAPALGLLLCCVVAPLLKVPGLAVAGICGVVLAGSGHWRLAGSALAAGVVGLLLYVLYGASVDWNLFVRVWAEQAGNRVGMLSALRFVSSPAGVNRGLIDGWWLLGWIGLGALAARGRRHAELFVVWPVAACAATMLVLANERQVAQYGWYRVAIYPELYLATGWLVYEAVRRRSLVLLTLVLALGGATATNWWLGGQTQAWVPNPLGLALMMAAVLVPSVLSMWRPADPVYRWLARGAAAVALAGMLVGNAVESAWLDRIFTRM